TEDTVEAAYSLIKDQYGAFQDRSSGFEGIDTYVIETKQRQLKNNSTAEKAPASDGVAPTTHSWWNPRVVWSQYLESNEELSLCVMALLSMTASEACVERSFSAQDLVHSKIRNRLADAQVEKEMFIRFNTKAIRSERKSTGGWVELDENYQPVVNEADFAPVVRLTVAMDEAVMNAEDSARMDPLLALVLPAEDDPVAHPPEVLSSPVPNSASLVNVEEKLSDENTSPELSFSNQEEEDSTLSVVSEVSDMDLEESSGNVLQNWIQSFIIRHKIGPNTKFNSDRSNILIQELLNSKPRIRIPERTMKDMIIAAARSM
ncbi:MAG: hAT transposon family protein, partial [Rhabdochlamydiaceae bacterium]